MSYRVCAAPILAAAFTLALACSGGNRGHGDTLDVSSMPDDVRADYAVFAQRCSKCHGLARPLDVGITSDEHWQNYVERMRHQPGSGISEADTAPILRFLHYYSADLAKKRSQP